MGEGIGDTQCKSMGRKMWIDISNETVGKIRMCSTNVSNKAPTDRICKPMAKTDRSFQTIFPCL